MSEIGNRNRRVNRKHVRHVMVLTSLWLLACSVWAESDDEELQALMALLEQETDLVTQIGVITPKRL